MSEPDDDMLDDDVAMEEWIMPIRLTPTSTRASVWA